MKFTLKLQLDSTSELAQFIQDMNMEIDLPFLSQSSDIKILELTSKICNLLDENSELHENIRIVSEHNNFLSEKILGLMVPADVQPEPEMQVKERINDFISDNTAPDQDAPPELHNDDLEPDHVPDAGETIEEIKTPPTYLCDVVVPCKFCGNEIVDKKYKEFCSNKCYQKNLYQSKKVKSPQKSPD